VDKLEKTDKKFYSHIKKSMVDDPNASLVNAVRVKHFLSGPRLSHLYPPLPGPSILNQIIVNLMDYFQEVVKEGSNELFDGSGDREMLVVLLESTKWLIEAGSEVDWIRLCGDLYTSSAAALLVQEHLTERKPREEIWAKWRSYLKSFRQFQDAVEVRAILVDCGEIDDGFKSVIYSSVDMAELKMEPQHILLLDFPLVPVGNSPEEGNPKKMIELATRSKCIVCRKAIALGTKALPWFSLDRHKEGTEDLVRQVPRLPQRQAWTPKEESFRPTTLPSETLERKYLEWIVQVTRARTLPMGFVCSLICEQHATLGVAFEYPPLPDIPEKWKKENKYFGENHMPKEKHIPKFTVPENPQELLEKIGMRSIGVTMYHTMDRLQNIGELLEDRPAQNSSGYIPIELELEGQQTNQQGDIRKTVAFLQKGPNGPSKQIKFPSNHSKFVVKLQSMASPGNEPMLLYNEDKTVHGYIKAETNRTHNVYSKLKAAVGKDGVWGILGPSGGRKAYLNARLGAGNKLEICPLKVLDSSMFQW